MKQNGINSNSLEQIGAQVDSDLSSIGEVKQIIKSLAKFIQGKKLYARNNPLLTVFAKEVTSAFDAFFKNEDELVLAIDRFSMKWREQIVYENTKREESLAFLLFKDGVGEISFQNSLAFEEVEKFTDIIIEDLLQKSREEDVVTKMWKADFDCISYRVLDEYLSGEFGEGKGSSMSAEPSVIDSDDHAILLPMFEDKGRVIVDADSLLKPLDTYLRDLIAVFDEKAGLRTQDEQVEDVIETVFKIGSEELKLCHEELLEERQQDEVLLLLRTMLDFTLISDNPSVMRDVYNVMERLVEYLIVEKQAARLAEVLVSIKSFISVPELKESARKFGRDLEKKLVDNRTLFYLIRGVQQWNKESEEILNYMRTVGPSTEEVLCKMLEDTESNRLRQEICDCLLETAGDRIEDIIAGMGKEKRELALASIYLAGSVQLSSIPQALKELIYYPDLRVREEMIKYIALSEDNEAASLLLKALGDEDKKIRIKALNALQGRNSPQVREALHALAFGKELTKRSEDEQEAVFATLGSVGDNETIARLNDLLAKKGILFNRNNEQKLLVIKALETLRDPAAREMLEKLAMDSNELVQTRAKRALADNAEWNSPD